MVGLDYIQIRTDKSFISLNESFFVDGRPSKTGIKRRNLRVSTLTAAGFRFEPNITDRVRIDVIADHYVTIGIPAALLGARYFELINASNIEKCFQALTDAGILEEMPSLEKLINTAEVVRLETACDITTEKLSKSDYARFQFFISNAFAWRIQSLINSFGVKSQAKSSKEMLKIYSKTREFGLARHSKFRQHFGLTIPTNLTRIEHRINSAKKIRKRYGSNKLRDVLALSTTKNTIGKALESLFIALDEEKLRKPKRISKPLQDRYSQAEQMKFDLEQIKAFAEECDSHNRVYHVKEINRAIVANQQEVRKSGLKLADLVKRQAAMYN